MSLARLSAAVLVLASALLVRPASAHVIVVDASGGGEFSSLVTAVAAAADGDTLLVRAGNYFEFGASYMLVAGKSLVIVAAGDGDVRTGPFQLNVGPGQRVVLRGLIVEADLDQAGPALGIGSGDVLAEACTLLGRDGSPVISAPFGGEAVLVLEGRVVLKDCVVEGGRGSDASKFAFIGAKPGGPAIDVLAAATIAVYGGSLTGGRGGDAIVDLFGGNGASGGHALLVKSDSTLLLAGCTVKGGDGGNGSANPGFFPPDNYAGGDAVHIDPPSDLSLQGASLAGGLPGVDGAGTPGTPGDALDVGPSVKVTTYAGPYRSLNLGAPASEGDVLALDYAGVAGDVVGLFVSASVAALPLPGKQGLFHLGAPLAGPWVLGPVGGTGALSIGPTLPNLGLGPDDAVTLLGQAFVKPASGATLLCSLTTTVLLDSSF